MKGRKALQRAAGFVLAAVLALGQMCFSNAQTIRAEEADTNAEGYQVTITADHESPKAGDTVHLTASVTNNGTAVTDLEAAGLKLWWWTDTWNDHSDGLGDAVYSNYDENSGNSFSADVTLPSVGNYYIIAELKEGDTTHVKETAAFVTTKADEGEGEDTTVEGELYVEKIKNLPEDFIMGMDISSVLSLFKSGVTFQDYEGRTIDNINDFCKFLADNGINYIRVRVWNDPYDKDGNGYGGGNNDVAAAAEIAKGVKAAGMKLLVDFHCSDFWADPSKQQAPKAWADFTLSQKEEAVKQFITDSLNEIDPDKTTVGMVQVGNETNGSFVGESSVENMCALFAAGAEAVRSYNREVKVAVHVTDAHRGMITRWAKNLDDNKVDYDILAASYYIFWHGTYANLKSEFAKVKETYGKDVLVAETSYGYTLKDSDGHDNTLRPGNNDTGDNITEPFTPQGQATVLRDVMNTVNEAGGLGVFYWEPAWLTVGDTTGLTGDELNAQIASNREKWEKFGSGWASSYAAEYDPKDAGQWFGGSAVDNQAMFYPDGSPVASMHVWEYVKTGAVSKYVSVESIETAVGEATVGGSYTLPETINVVYNKGAAKEKVEWNKDDIEIVDTAKTGTKLIRGTVTFSEEINDGRYAGKETGETVYILTIEDANLITDAEDAGFEKGDNFTVSGSGISAIPSKDDPYEGNGSMHWYNTVASQGVVTYNNPISLSAGNYVFEAVAQGDYGDTVTLSVLNTKDEVLFTGDPTTVTGWASWMNVSVGFTLEEQTEVRLQITVDMKAGGWGTADRLYLRGTGSANRVAGTTRYDTAIGSAEAMRDGGSFTSVVIASAENFPDALAGSALAAQKEAPILLVGKSAEGTERVMNYINSFVNKDGSVYLLGGTAAVPESIEKTLEDMGYQNVKRLSGTSRYETNLQIVDEMGVTAGGDIAIVSGKDFADALSISGVAGLLHMPVILTGGSLTEEAMEKIKALAPKNIYLIGGTAAVSEEAEEQAKSLCASVKRVAGMTRYETSVAIAKAFRMNDAEHAVLAYGGNFPDGLTGGVLAAKLGAPILLVSDDNYKDQKAFIESSKIGGIYAMGGTAVISEETLEAFQ